MEHLSEEFWSERYRSETTGWDLGGPSAPLVEYIDQLINKDLRILIPGCGRAYEAEYLHKKGFANVHLIDLSAEPLRAFLMRVPDFPEDHIHQGDFFLHSGSYDLILEQTMFCAIDPMLRSSYAHQAANLLSSNGRIAGLLFNFPLEDGPPYGGTVEEYRGYFAPYFSFMHMEPCTNSIPPRSGRELFVILKK